MEVVEKIEVIGLCICCIDIEGVNLVIVMFWIDIEWFGVMFIGDVF